jgi:hypothetical protein
MLTKITQSVPHFFPYYFVEIAPNPTTLSNDFHPQTGCLAIEQIWPHLSNPLYTVYYLSGPPLMWNFFSNELRARQVPMDQIRIDAWE